MKLASFSLLFLVAFLYFSETHSQILDPFHSNNFIDNINRGFANLASSVRDTFKPLVKKVKKINQKILKPLNKLTFNVNRDILNSLNEVFGTNVNLNDVQFYLSTSEHNEQLMDFDEPQEFSVFLNGYDRAKVFFIIHGWMSSKETPWYNKLKNAILKRYPGSYVVLVDWSRAASVDYPSAAFNTESVGDVVGVFVENILRSYNVPRKNVVLIGHSLGGHVSGWAGKRFQKLTGIKLPNIIALDPAGPLFILRPDNRRLNKNDAERVIVIHTDAGRLGFLIPCGTVDFFPNGGTDQAGCEKINVTDINTVMNPVSCNHLRAPEYLVEAMNTTEDIAFRARKCSSFTHFRLNEMCQPIESGMGNLEEGTTGSFYLETASIPPYSLPLKPLVIKGVVLEVQSGGSYEN